MCGEQDKPYDRVTTTFREEFGYVSSREQEWIRTYSTAMSLGPTQQWQWVVGTLIYEGVKLRNDGRLGFLIIFYLFLHQPNNLSENIFLFYLHLFKPVAKNTILKEKKYWRGHLPFSWFPS